MELSPTWVVTRSLPAVGTPISFCQRAYGKYLSAVHLSHQNESRVRLGKQSSENVGQPPAI